MKKHNKRIVMMASIILIVTVVVAGTLAWLFTNSNAVTNTFVPAKVGNNVVETNTSTAKTNVRIQNSINGNTDQVVDAYIRAAYVVTWQKNVSGTMYMLPADESDYTYSLNLDDKAEGGVTGKWEPYGDYYYFTGIVAPGAVTDVLINNISPKPEKATEMAADGYYLHVEIISQSIQAKGVTAAGIPAVVDAWKVVTVNADGTLNVPQNP